MAKATGETIWWSLFAAGGVVSAMVIPALIFITGIALPFVEIGAVPIPSPTYGWLYTLVGSIVGRLVLFVVISLSFFHCANRFFHTTKDLGIHGARGLIAFLCYGGAIVGTGVAAWIVGTL